MDVGSQHTILTNANSSLAYNDSALLTATATSIDFDFSAKNLTVDGKNLEMNANAFKAAGKMSVEVSGTNTTIKGSATTVIKGGVVQIN